MGNCCTAERQVEVVVGTGKKPKAYTSYSPGEDKIIDEILDDKVVAGLSGVDKILLIQKIQAGLRGAIARRKV